MNKLELLITEKQEGKYTVLETQILIDGENLIDTLKEFEKRFDEKLAGKYSGLNPETLYKHLSGEREFKAILGCDCGEWGCWPFVAKINEKDSQISWSNFKQPYRKEWDYSDLEEFVFDKKQYHEQIDNLLKINE